MSFSCRPIKPLFPWSIHDNVRISNEKFKETPSVKSINFIGADMGMITTLNARGLSGANYPEFVARTQDVSQACWTIAGKNFKPVFELSENRILEVVRSLSIGYTLTVIQKVISDSECTQGSFSARKTKTRKKGELEELRKRFRKGGTRMSFQFLYAIGYGDIWLLLELVMIRFLGKKFLRS